MAIEKVYIPTLGRLSNNGEKQHTYKNLSEKYKQKTIFVIQESESTEEFLKDKQILIVPNDTGIAKKRELISIDAGNCKFCMFDDDLSFYWKPDIWEKKKERCTEEDINKMFDLMDSYLDDVVCAGLGSTYTLYTPGKEIEDAFRVCLNVFYNGSKLPIKDLDWLSCPHAEDFYIVLQLLEKGYLNRINLRYLASTTNITNSKGGASIHRTLQKHNDSMEFLGKRFPKYVTITHKEVKDGMCKNGETKAKAHILWKKLYKDNATKREQEEFFN